MLPDGSGDADRLCQPERPRICRDRAAAARARHAPAGRRGDGGDRRLDARQSRRGAGADARESELYLLQGIDRAGAARRAGAAGDAARHASPTDPKFVPLGAPVFLDLDRAEADGLWVAQDTGGAIKGANRFDTFWGAGAAAEVIAGGMAAKRAGDDPAAQGRGGACEPYPLTKPSCGQRVAATIRPLSREPLAEPADAGRGRSAVARRAKPPRGRVPPPRAAVATARRARPRCRRDARRGWDKRLRSGTITPDRTLDLHGHHLDGAWSAIDHALERAIAAGERVVLLITGHERRGEPPVAARADPRRGPRLAGGVAPCRADRRGARRASPPRRRRQPLHHPAPTLDLPPFINPTCLVLFRMTIGAADSRARRQGDRAISG